MMKIKAEAQERHVLTITVDNEAGILAKIAGLFTARGYNIDSLTVADITDEHDVSRITIVTHGPPAVIDQIHAQLERLVPVHKVTDLTEVGPYVARELVKLGGQPRLREGFTTDNGNIILDVHGMSIVDPVALETAINHIVGVVTNGLFARRGADVLLLGTPNGVKTYKK